VIKIRYADLPQGRHAHVRSCGRQPVIYLLPGLTPAQRRDALRRLVRASRQGYGPRLRAAGVGCAVARDSAKSTARNALAAIRCHPAGSAALTAFVAAAVVCYALFVTVTVRLSPGPSGPPGVAGAAPSRPQDAGGLGRSPGGGAAAPAGTQPAVAGKHGTSPAGPGAGSPGTGSSGTGPSGPGRPASPGPLPTGTWSAPGGLLPSTPAGLPPSSSPRPGPAPAPPPAGAAPPPGQPGGLCLQVGPLGICVSG
jgi:hypothetical protein